MRKKRLLEFAALVVAVGGLAGGWTLMANAGNPALDAARSATAKYHRIDVAKAAGYGRFVDANGIACIDMPGLGAMGIHYVNGSLVGNPAIEATQPEALVYEPEKNGQLRLVAAEYIVIKSAWDANHAHRRRSTVRAST